jgi:hypothetical protein
LVTDTFCVLTSVISVCLCKISSVIRCLKTEKLFNSLSVNTVCLVTLYVESRPQGNEHVVSIYCLGVNVRRENESVVIQYLFKTGMHNLIILYPANVNC